MTARSALNELVEKAQEEILNDLQDKIHLLSVGASFIPIAGTAVSIGLDALNVAISLARGNTDEAKLYTLFAIPIIGDIAGVGALLYVGGAYANRFYDYFFGTPDPELPPEFREIIYHIEWVSGGANNSFAAGTGVVTGIDEDGNYVTTNIEDLEVGDVVLSSDEFNPDGTPKFTIVTDVRSTTVYEQTVVTYVDANGNVETLKTTAGHEFYVEGLGWVTAGELAEGQELLLPDGSTATVTSVETEAIPEGLTVYNLTVSDGATYYVDEGEGNVSPVLVHNAGLGRAILNIFRSRGGARVTKVTTTITRKNIGRGTGTTLASRVWTALNGRRGDDAGHIIGRIFGGRGGLRSGNIVPINRTVNRGRMAQFEKDVASRIKGNIRAEITATLSYAKNSNSLRPTILRYEVKIFQGKRHIETITKKFKNS